MPLTLGPNPVGAHIVWHYSWQVGHQYVVRPPTVALARLRSHRGHAPSLPRTATKLPV